MALDWRPKPLAEETLVTTDLTGGDRTEVLSVLRVVLPLPGLGRNPHPAGEPHSEDAVRAETRPVCLGRNHGVRRCRSSVGCRQGLDPSDVSSRSYLSDARLGRDRCEDLNKTEALSSWSVATPGPSAQAPWSRSRCQAESVSRFIPSEIGSSMVGALEDAQRTADHSPSSNQIGV